MSDPIYQAALGAAVLYPQPHPGLVQVSGPDRIDFIQRQTTNDITRLNSNNVINSALINASARLLDLYQIIAWDQNSFILVTLPGNGENAFKFLKSKIFFADQVEVEDRSGQFALFDIEGPQAIENLKTLISESPGQDEVLAMPINGIPVHIWGQRGLTAEIGYRLLVSKQDSEAIIASLDLPMLDHATREILRVEAGMPTNPNELNDNYTPLETDLRYAIHDAKGCYTGQEVIARQITYDKITRQLVKLQLERTTEPGATVNAEGKKIGEVTSAANSPRSGAIALAIIKRPYFESGTPIEISHDGQTIRGTVR